MLSPYGAFCFGATPGAPGDPLYSPRDHREAAARLARGSRLDCGVQRKHVGLLRDVRDELDDLADLLRGLAQALDALGGLLDLLADVVHAGDGILHAAPPLFVSADRS